MSLISRASSGSPLVNTFQDLPNMNVITTRDENGIPTDEITLRAYNIMQRLIRANPELTQGLVSGIEYNLHVVEGYEYYAAFDAVVVSITLQHINV